MPYLTLMDGAAPQRRYPLRELFNGLRWSARARHSRNGKIVERADDSGGDAQASWHADRRISSYRRIEVGVGLSRRRGR